MADPPIPVVVDPSIHDITITPKKDPDDLRAERQMRQFAFYAAMAVLLVTGLGAAWLAFGSFDGISDVSREWARGTLSAIVGGVVGFAFAKK